MTIQLPSNWIPAINGSGWIFPSNGPAHTTQQMLDSGLKKGDIVKTRFKGGCCPLCGMADVSLASGKAIWACGFEGEWIDSNLRNAVLIDSPCSYYIPVVVEEIVSSHPCTCPMTTLLRFGCQCNGI